MVAKKPTKKTKQIKKKPKKEKKQYATIEKAAAHCKVSSTTFRSFMIRHPEMPIVEKSVYGSGYKIDLEALDAWREKNNLLNWIPKPEMLPAGENAPRTTSTKDRKAQIQTDLLQIELDEKMGKLIPRDDVVKSFHTVMAQISKHLDLTPAYIGRKLGLSPDVVEALRKRLDESRLMMAQMNFCAGLEEEDAGNRA